MEWKIWNGSKKNHVILFKIPNMYRILVGELNEIK